MNANPKRRGQHALKVFVSTDLRARLGALSDSLDRPMADICRTLLWIGLPIMEGLDQAQQRGADWWVQRFQGSEPDETIGTTS
jgi:hypothetical protein